MNPSNPLREAIVFLWENAFSGRIGRTFLLALILFLIGVFANGFGIDIETTLSRTLAAIDGWLDVLAPWLDMAGNIVFRLFFALVFMGCVVWGYVTLRTASLGVFSRLRGSAGLSAAAAFKLGSSFLAALVLGYFAWVGMFI